MLHRENSRSLQGRDMLRRLLLVLFFAGSAASANRPTGRWALYAGDTALMVFEVEHTAKGWAGRWQRPAHFTSDGNSFSDVVGPVENRVARVARELPDGVELTFSDPRPGSMPTIFIIRPRTNTAADLNFIGFGKESATLTRVDQRMKLGPWNPGRTYVRTTERSTNSEMTAIFDADQAARARPESINWKALDTADKARRKQAQMLLDAGNLRSAEDFYHAAFVFQHGHEPEDYLKAHALALIASARGKPAATWIAAATLDRYLQSVGQPQIYGTQFQNVGGTWTQAPYRQDVISDSLREASGVPPLSEQETQRLDFEKQRTGSKR